MTISDVAEELRADAWCGEEAHGPLSGEATAWAMRRNVPAPLELQPALPLDLAEWRHPKVGWGVVLPDRDDMTGADKAVGADAPEPIRELLARRNGAPVLRYRPDVEEGKLRRYESDGSESDLSAHGERGVQKNAFPYYLLICGSPAEIPWGVQYRLQTGAFVGRLDLSEQGLARYVEALLGEWADSPRDVTRPLIWAVDHGHPDITWLMRRSIAEQLLKLFAGDSEFDVADGVRVDAKATGGELGAALAARRPAFVVTSSHGATLPLNDSTTMRGQLGLPVDHDRVLVEPRTVVEGWNPCGAVWYAHACCSAGADTRSKFSGVVGRDSSLGQTLDAIAGVGACTAPLPRQLLGGANPLGAFIGHVEPTFDWTLRDPTTGQVTTHHIVKALYHRLHLASRPPIGLAMMAYFDAVAGMLVDYANAIEAVNAHHPAAEETAFRAKLMAFDRLTMVILGDPTVRLPIPAE